MYMYMQYGRHPTAADRSPQSDGGAVHGGAEEEHGHEQGSWCSRSEGTAAGKTGARQTALCLWAGGHGTGTWYVCQGTNI